MIKLSRGEKPEALALSKQNPFRLKGIDDKGIGRRTIVKIGLNDPDKVMIARMIQWEDIHQKLEEYYEDIQENGYHEKYKQRLKKLLNKCTAVNTYSAVKASNMLEDEYYKKIRQIMKENGAWSDAMIELENEVRQIALQFV